MSPNLLIVFGFLIGISDFRVVVALERNYEEFRDCIKGVKEGYLAERNSDRYEHLNSNYWNIRVPQVNPQAYFVPATAQEVSTAITCGRNSNVRIVAKSAGHSFESYSSGDSNSVVVDFRDLNQIIINEEDGTAMIGPGALLGTIVAQTSEVGFGLPMGQCFSVGIGGHALGGGFGYFHTKYGVTADSILEMTMVDARGNSHTVNAKENSDLYWALKGIGSGDIGFVTQFKFKLFPTNDLRINLVFVQFNMNDLDLVFFAWQNWLIWIRKNDPTIFSQLFVGGIEREGNVVTECRMHVLSLDYQGEGIPRNVSLINRVREFFPTPVEIGESFPTYFDLVAEIGEPTSDPLPTEINLEYLNNLRQWNNLPSWEKLKTFFVDETFEENELKITSDLAGQVPPGQAILLFTAMGGFVNGIPPNATSYVHRTSYYTAGVYAFDDKKGLDWVHAFLNGTKFMDNGESSQNLLDEDLIEGEEYLRRYYGSNAERLIQVKTKWDPDNYFRNPQSIPVKSNAADSAVFRAPFVQVLFPTALLFMFK